MPAGPRASLALTATAAVLAGIVSCSNGPSAPSTGRAPTLGHVQLAAPASLEPGESVPFTLNAVKSDGSIENVTARALWTSSSDAVQISALGVAIGRDRGEAVVAAQFEGRTASRAVLVLENGTFRLTGRVSDRLTERGIPGVSVTVASGIGAGLRTATDADGAYALYGVNGEVVLRVENLQYGVTYHPLDAAVSRTVEIPILAGKHIGTYSLTIHTGSCSETFPQAARTRVYTAEVTDRLPNSPGASLYFALQGPGFLVSNGFGNGFGGTINPRDVVLDLSNRFICDWDACGTPVAERFEGGALLVDGQGGGHGNLDVASGSFTGEIVIFKEDRAPFSTITSRCKTDRFELVRR